MASSTASMSQQSTYTKSSEIGGNRSVPKSPLLLFEPFNIIVFLSFYSPVILAILITSLSLLFQNFKGFIYLGYLLGACLARNYFYQMGGAKPSINDGTICTSVQYTKYGNPT